VLLRTSLRVDAIAITTAPERRGGFSARLASLCVRGYVLKQLSSRVRSKDWQPRSLAHEQVHFDLTEWFARVLRQRLANAETHAATSAGAAEALRATVARVAREVAERHGREQARYDRATGHGHRTAVQARWAREIAARLAGSDGFGQQFSGHSVARDSGRAPPTAQ
jgi:hypothetical protein